MSHVASVQHSNNLASTVWMLASRQWVRFFRQRGRVVAALGQPILFWLLFGIGFQTTFRGGDQDYMTYYLPGTLALIVLFTAIFTTISVIEDRNEGFLQAVLVAPVPRWTIALGNILGGAAIAWVQTMIFLTLALLTGVAQWSSDMVGVVVLLGIVSLTLTALGLCFAWPMDSTQGFHAVMSLVLLPLWLLSGAFFPVPQLSSQSSIGQWIMGGLMRSNPLSYAIAGLRQLMGAQPSNEIWMPDLATSWIGSCLFLVVTFVAACQIVSRHHR